MKLMKHTSSLLVFVLLALLGCNKDDGGPTQPPDLPDARTVFVLNEGNFQSGNASLGTFDPETQQTNEKVFEAVNDRALGDVLQSMTVFDGKGYLVVNNSGRIEVIDLETAESIQSIDGFDSPRYLLPLSDERAYVSDLSGGAISVLNLSSGQVEKEITVSDWTEQMVLAEGVVFVTAPLTNQLFMVDPLSDQLVGNIEVPFGPQFVRVDRDGMLWVLSTGKEVDDLKPALTRIDPVEKTILWSQFFEDFDPPGELEINAAGDQLCFLQGDVFLMGIDETALPKAVFIEAEGKLFYGLGIDPTDGTVYVSDAIDYVQKGKCYRYTAEGVALDVFETGIIPGDFAFKP